MARPEPFVKVTERIMDTPTPIEVTSGAAIGCTIVAPKGPKLARILSDDQFLKTYTLDGKVPRNAHITFLNAYYLSFFAELIVARSMNSDAVGGIAIYASSLGADATLSAKNIYLKDGQWLSQYYTLTLADAPQTVPMSPAEYTEDFSDKYWGVIINEILYYGGDLEKVLWTEDPDTGEKTSNFTCEGEPVDVSNLPAVACDLLIDEDSTKSYLAQVVDFIASEINKGDEVVAVVEAGGSIRLWCDQWTDYNANMAQLPDEDGVFELREVSSVEASCTLSGPNPESEPDGIKVLTIYSKEAGSVNANEYKVKFSKTRNLTAEAADGRHKSIVFNMTLNGDEYVMSFDKNAVDVSGVNCYIESFNTESEDWPYVFVVEENDYSNFRFGAFAPEAWGEGFIDQDSSASVSYLRSALNVLDEQELYDIRYLAPVGITSIPYIKAYAMMGARRFWFAPMDIPWDRTNFKAISAYTNQLPDDYNGYCVGPFDKNTGLCGWTIYIAASTLYWERVMTNRRARAEFAPVFDKDTGIFQYNNPVKLLKKDQREKLISLPLSVNYVIYDQPHGYYYMNDNWTHYSKNENVAGEEMNVRMMHMISLDVKKIMANFKAKINNARYRRLAYDSIDNYFKNTLMTQEYKPDDYLITIDETNNTPEVIHARKMAVRIQVRYYNSIKYIDVLNDAYAVGGSAFEE